MEFREDCPCTKPGCPNHGNCDACRINHSAPGKKPVFCEREESVES